MKKQAISSALLSAAIVCFAANEAHAARPTESSIFIDDVSVRDGVSADIHVRVYANANTPCNANTIFAVHGSAHTAATWGPLAEAMFDRGERGAPVCRVVAIDLPGHGESSLPNGMLFGELDLNDYVTTIFGALDRLEQDHFIRPTTVMGHSMGGMIVQMMQQRLLDQGSNLRDEYHIDHALLLAPSLPEEVRSSASDLGIAAYFAALFGTSNPELGSYMNVPAPVWATAFFQNLNGEVAPGAPTAEEAMALGYVSIESQTAFNVATGAVPGIRPHMEAGAFAAELGTDLDVVTCEHDPFLLPAEHTVLYDYLTGDETRAGLTMVTGTDATHDVHVSNARGWVNAVAGSVSLP